MQRVRARWRRWRDYRRCLNALVSDQLDAGYRVGQPQWEQFRDQARRESGYK